MSSVSSLWKSSPAGRFWPIPEMGKNAWELSNLNISQALSWPEGRAVKSKVFYVEHFSILRKGCPHGNIFRLGFGAAFSLKQRHHEQTRQRPGHESRHHAA
jgi:hypothetical protein